MHVKVNTLLRRKTIAIVVFMIGVSFLLAVTGRFLITEVGTSDQALQSGIQVSELNNGIQVVLAPASGSGLTTVNVWVRAGSAQEPPDRQGLAHYYEHMVFKNSERFPGSASDWVESRGGDINASTYYDYTEYHTVIPSEHTEFAISLLADMVTRRTFTQEDMEKERNVVLREKDRQEDDASIRLEINTRSMLLGSSPYAQPVLGTEESIKSITVADLVQWAREFYVPGNMTVVVVSDVEPARLQERIEASFGAIKPESLPPLTKPGTVMPTSQRQHTLAYSGNFEHLAVAWALPPADDLEKIAIRDVLANLLALKLVLDDGSTSVVHDLTFSPNLILAASEFPQYVDSDDVRDQILSRVASIRRGQISREHIALAKKWLIDDMKTVRKSGLWFAGQLGLFSVVTGNPLDFVSYIEHVESVGRKQLIAMANEHLTAENRFEYRMVANDDGVGRAGIDEYLDGSQYGWSGAAVVMLDDVQYVFSRVGSRVSERFMQFAAWIKSKYWTWALAGVEIVESEDFLILDNGIRILLLPESSTDFVEVRVLVGSDISEATANEAGISLFTSGFLLYWLDEDRFEGLDAWSRVGTWFDATVLTLNATSTSWPAALPPFLKYIVKPVWHDGRMDSYRDTVIQDIRSLEADPFEVAGSQLYTSLLGEGGYANSRAGTIESVSSFALDDLIKFHERYYVPDNMVIAVAGNFDPKMMVATLVRAVGKLEPAEASREARVHDGAPGPAKMTSTDWEDIQLAWILIGFPGPGLASDDYATLRILNSIMGSGSSSWLFSHFREQEADVYLAYSFVRSLPRRSVMVLYAQVLPEDRKNFVETTLAEVRNIATGGVTEEELQTAIAREVGLQLRYGEWIGDRAVDRGFDILSDIGHGGEGWLIEQVDDVTVEDVSRLAQEMLERYAISEAVPAIQQ
jgi:zinc protease